MTPMSSRGARRRPPGRPDPGHPRNRSGVVGDGVHRTPAGNSGRAGRRHLSEAVLPSGVLGAVVALSVAFGSLAIIVILAVGGWVLAGDRSSFAATFDVAARSWLVVNAVPLEVRGGLVWLPPLGATAALSLLMMWGAARAVRVGGIHGTARLVRFHGVATATYALSALAIALLAGGLQVSVTWLFAPVIGALLYGLAAGFGVLREAGLWGRVTARIPVYLRRDIRAAVAGLASLAAVAAVGILVSLAIAWPIVATMLGDLKPGWSGSVGLVLLSMAYIPTAVVWGMGYLVGAGFSIGTAGVVAPWHTPEAVLPAFPLLAAIPTTNTVWHLLVLVAPLAAGLVAARSLACQVPLNSWLGWGMRARMAGVAGGLAAACTFLADGTMGGGLTHLGPNPVLVAGLVAVWFTIGSVLWEFLAKWRHGSRPAQSHAEVEVGVHSERDGGFEAEPEVEGGPEPEADGGVRAGSTSAST